MSNELEAGRYRLTELPDGSGVITRAVSTCETCRGCGCGTQAEHIIIPAVFIKLVTGKQVEMHEVMGLAAQLPKVLKELGLNRGRGPAEESAEAHQSRRAARRARRSAPGVGLPDQETDRAADPASTAVAG